MPRKSASFRAGVLVRDVAGLKRRVQALEKVIWPAAKPQPPAAAGKRCRIEVDEPIARRALIDQYYRDKDEAWLKEFPELRKGRRTRHDELNAYLRARGFPPEREMGE